MNLCVCVCVRVCACACACVSELYESSAVNREYSLQMCSLHPYSGGEGRRGGEEGRRRREDEKGGEDEGRREI